ncbi:MAG: DUF432 domain-containing protein [Thermoplasmata archaeon]|nr:MAG: DUF432 domain-containing protein [Thermoplasmata archaeon]
MFGFHEAPVTIEKDDILISFEKKGDSLLYKRTCNGENVNKILLTESKRILINPIEPLHKPKEMTPYLLLELKRPVVVEPKATKKIFLTFPIEIGIFIIGREESKSLDIMTLAKQKLTLYGEVRGGVICKHYASDVHSSLPAVDPVREGVVELTISNTTARWHEITQVVFNAYGMKIYYNENTVAMRASMRIYTGGIGEIEFYDSPLYKEMSKSIELYTARRIKVATTKFIMEWGL